MLKWIKELTLCLWLQAMLGQKLGQVSELTFFCPCSLGLDMVKKRQGMKHCWLTHIGQASEVAYTVLQPV